MNKYLSFWYWFNPYQYIYDGDGGISEWEKALTEWHKENKEGDKR